LIQLNAGLSVIVLKCCFEMAPKMANSRSYQKNEKIYEQGEAATYVYQVASGAVRISSKLNNGQRQIGSFYFPGDIFGLEPGTRHRRRAEAVVKATTLRRVKRKAIMQKAQSNLPLARTLWNIATRDLLHAENRSVILGLSARERVAAFILEMNSRIGVDGGIELWMKGPDIRDYIGVSEETISREISKLADKGVLRRNGSSRLVRRLKVNRPARLRAMLPLAVLDLPPISGEVARTIFSPKTERR
jgi:CRP/FNR family transcriptional regulator, nitrogen fixation regulation protein